MPPQVNKSLLQPGSRRQQKRHTQDHKDRHQLVQAQTRQSTHKPPIGCALAPQAQKQIRQPKRGSQAMPRPRPPGWVAPPEKHEEGTRRADRIVGKEVVNRKLQIYLMRRAEADAVADLVEPGAPPPNFKLVFDKSGRSQYKVRCAFDAERTAVTYGFEDTSSLFTLEGRPRTAKRPKTRTSSRRTRRVSELTDDESCIRPATAMAATLRASLSSSLETPPPSRPRSAQLSRRSSAATPRARPSTATLRASRGSRGAAAGRGAEAARQRRETLQREREDMLRAAVERKAAACGTEGNVVEFRKKQHARRERWLAACALAASGLDLKRRATTVEKRRETDAGWRAENQAAKILGRNWRSQRIRRHVYWSARLAVAVKQNLRLLLAIRIDRKRRAARRLQRAPLCCNACLPRCLLCQRQVMMNPARHPWRFARFLFA